MESRHFFLVIADVEGKILKFNRGFEKINPRPEELPFSNFLSSNSETEFNYSLELMLGSPKIRRHLMLDHPNLKNEGFSQIWWEFSVVTTREMDISGIVGIGVGMPFLEQELPWDNLVDVLGFGQIVLDQDFKVKSWDERILNWFDPSVERWEGKPVAEVLQLNEVNQINKLLAQTASGDRPKCFLTGTTNPDIPSLAVLLTASQQCYNLFLMPKADPMGPTKSETPLIPPKAITLFAGAVFVLNTAGKLVQQNESAKNLGRIWKGRAYSEGFQLNFSTQPKRFLKLISAIENAKKGDESELELKFLLPNQEFLHWTVSVKPIQLNSDDLEGVLIQAIEITSYKAKSVELQQENERLRELALSPSHILRGPLSSMLGILDLLDQKQLDKENQKLFGYLKPLAKELDHVIRFHAKKMSTFS